MKFGILAASMAMMHFISIAGAQTEREAHTHEHGSGTLNIAIEGNSVAMEFEAPGADIVGFEHEPGNDEEKLKTANALKILNKPQTIFAVAKDAGCELSSSNVEIEKEGEHNAFHGAYVLKCAAPEKIGEITFAYFETFPNAQELDVKLITESGQSAYEVERDNPVLVLKPN